MRLPAVGYKCKLLPVPNILSVLVTGLIFTASYLLFAQEKPNEPEDRISASTNQEKKSSKEKIKNRHRKYAQWLRSNVDVLVPEAKQKGFVVSDEDILVQKKAFRSFFPDLSIVEYELENEILARKYAWNFFGGSLSQENIKDTYNKLKIEYSDESIPSLEDILPMVETRALIETNAVTEELNAIRKRNLIKRNEDNVQKSQTWPSEKLRFDASNSGCLAQHIDSTECLLNVGQFNHAVKYYFIPQYYSLDTARQRALNDMLSDIFIAIKAREKGFQNKSNLPDLKKSWLDWIGSSIKYRKIGLPEHDPSALLRVYEEYYDALFSERFDPCYSIIGSSDSQCIDSLLKLIRNKKNDSSATSLKKGSAPKKNDTTMPWSKSYGKLLPEDFFKFTDSLQIDGISGVVRTPYGFFIVRLDSIHIREEIRFEDANDECIFLATKQKWQNLDSILEDKAYSIYKSDNLLNREADTLDLIAFLMPQCTQPPICRCSAVNEKPAVIDSMSSGIRLQSTVLPLEIRNDLLDQYQKLNDKKKMIGPLNSRLGVWYFKVTGCKSGIKRIPFSRIKEKLIDSLVIQTMDAAQMDSPFKTPDSVLDEIAFSRCFAPYFFGRADDDSAYTRNSEPGGGTSANGEIENPKSRSDRIFQQGKKELEKWISKIKITLP